MDAPSSSPAPPMTVLLAARSMGVTIGLVCFLLGRQDALVMAETRLWREADERRERESGKSEAEGRGRAPIGRLHAGAARLAGGGNGVPLTSRRRRRTRPGRAGVLAAASAAAEPAATVDSVVVHDSPSSAWARPCYTREEVA